MGTIKKERIVKDFSKFKRIIKKLINKKRFERALCMIETASKYMYEANQIYCDDELEDMICNIATELLPQVKECLPESKRILFFDGFGFDTRGLSLIYIRALIHLGYELLLVTFTDRKGLFPTIEAEINTSGGCIQYLERDKHVKSIIELNHFIEEFKPARLILYAYPWDSIGLAAAARYAGYMQRFLINLTDHAFWLGKQSADYFVEFRDYGASVSYYKRGIAIDSLIKLPYYPVIDKEKPFQGFSFDLEGKKLIFSGGSLYKTLGSGNEYYHIVRHILSKHKDTIFLFAGNGDGSELKKVIGDFPQRVFWINERQDLYQVMCHCYLYLSTYPMIGGLMSQYAVAANKVPFTLLFDDCSTGTLLNQGLPGIEYYKKEEFLLEIDRCLQDLDYLRKKEKALTGQIISSETFEKELKNTLEKHTTNLEVNVFDVQTEAFQKTYLDRLTGNSYGRIFAKKRQLFIVRYFPLPFLRGVLALLLGRKPDKH